MIFVNPNLNGKKTAEFSKRDFPHLFTEDGRQTAKTYIFLDGENVIIESTEGAQEIERAADLFIKKKIAELSEEIRRRRALVDKLREMIKKS